MVEAELVWAIARESSLDRPCDGSFLFADQLRGNSRDRADT